MVDDGRWDGLHGRNFPGQGQKKNQYQMWAYTPEASISLAGASRVEGAVRMKGSSGPG